ncbi:ArgR family transcriptional regulator [Candidatus Berkiella aquae]|uniref:Arginine repressor n=1 Tax=Candidatus Berkiella aquae TaxID=295108 RepID=A0A0Q9YS37_9GAMM|nr:ArgR family transcriptional regulator [Candidatus Berkiella aquae]MCS5711925.1 ArgR family transcriptional regulator [Candidatus Berkiella aquae]
MAHDHVMEGHILNLIQTHPIYEQAELQELLKERGYDIPQATLSRKLKKMKIAKVDGVYKVVQFNMPVLPPILNMQISESGIVVLHVHPGQASSLAYYFDHKYVSFSQQNPTDSGILGTIAGDDTVILIIRSKADLPKVLALFHEDFPYLGTSALL